ncbi:MAG: tetratricopeptide repeat protein, partial [Phycisphaerales bacterium]
ARTDPSAAVHERLGFARFRLKEYPAAAANFERALELDPDYFPALNGLGVCTLNDWIAGDRRDPTLKERGVALLRRSIQLEPDQPQIREILTRYGR